MRLSGTKCNRETISLEEILGEEGSKHHLSRPEEAAFESFVVYSQGVSIHAR